MVDVVIKSYSFVYGSIQLIQNIMAEIKNIRGFLNYFLKI